MEGTDVKGSVTMGDYQCGLEGSRAAMSAVSREIESVCGNASASVRPFLSCFAFEPVVEALVRERLKRNRNGEVDALLPPRKFCSRGGVRERRYVNRAGESARRPPDDLRRESIRRRVMKCWKEDTLLRQAWGVRLMAFHRELVRRVSSGEVRFSAPELIKIVKGTDKSGRKTYRTVAKFNSLADRVVLSLATAYVRDRLELVLGECCYSFRRDARVNHETAVEELQRWREAHAGGTMFVAECDIRKFFDSIPHETVRRRWNELSARLGLEPAARHVVEAYLNAYSYDGECRCGLPQGGALSTVLANLVLAAADDRVRCGGDLFYARYCDDVVFAHADEDECRRAMARYEGALAELDLPMHPKRDFTYVDADGNADAEYYEIKTKGPFRWAEPKPGETDVAPWVSFVGSQIRYDGATRIRKESVERHIRSLGRETAKAVRELEGTNDIVDSFAWYSRFRNRLIRKGVGYVTAKLRDCDNCWAAAFGKVTTCDDTRREMRRLDHVRENLLAKIARLLRQRGIDVKRGHRFKGNPFSYHAFLVKIANRPTNLHRRRLRFAYSAV